MTGNAISGGASLLVTCQTVIHGKGNERPCWGRGAFSDRAMTNFAIDLSTDYVRLVRKEDMLRQSIQTSPRNLLFARCVLSDGLFRRRRAQWRFVTQHARFQLWLAGSRSLLNGGMTAKTLDTFFQVFRVVEGNRLRDAAVVRTDDEQSAQGKERNRQSDNDDALHDDLPSFWWCGDSGSRRKSQTEMFASGDSTQSDAAVAANPDFVLTLERTNVGSHIANLLVRQFVLECRHERGFPDNAATTPDNLVNVVVG